MKYLFKDEPGPAYLYGTSNIAHTFTWDMWFSDWLNGLEPAEQGRMSINKLTWKEFLLGNEDQWRISEHMFTDEPIPCSLVIKQANKQKIESHMWFFKGFAEFLDPEYC